MNFYIEQLANEDYKNIDAIFRDPVIAKTYMFPEFKNDEERVTCIKSLISYASLPDSYIRGIYLNNQLIGFINDMGIENGEIELGWVIHSEYHGLGYGTKAVGMAIEELKKLGIEKITAGAFEDNYASIRVMQKCGMVQEKRVEYLNNLGKKHKCIYYSMKI